MAKMTHQAFLDRARALHGDRYDYTPTHYAGSHESIDIICPDHGLFRQKAYQHLRYGCRSCGNAASADRRRQTVPQFVDKARAVHGLLYDYSKIRSIASAHARVPIICALHGLFEQAANDHLKGSGCRMCGVASSRKTRSGTRTTTVAFIADARSKHGSKYDYETTQFLSWKTKISYRCPSHGVVHQYPSNHLAGNGCSLCADAERTIPMQDFLDRPKPDYVQKYICQSYTSMSEKAEFLCPDHGVFTQLPTDHLNGHGCPRCWQTTHRTQADWLRTMGIPEALWETTIPLLNRNVSVDAYDPTTNTVYEFWGDFWHGNPDVFEPDSLNTVTGTTFGHLYEKTIQKRVDIRESGYNLIEIWEKNWRLIVARNIKRGV